MLQPESIAPPFTLADLDNSPHSLAEMLARSPVVLVFFKISCPVCQMTLPFLDRIAAGSFQIVAISQDDAASTRRFHSKFGVALPTLLDREAEHYPVSNAFGIAHVPSLFLVEPGGAISFTSEGFVRSDVEALGLRAGIAPFLQDEAVPAWKPG